MAARYLPQCPYCKRYLNASDRPPRYGPLVGTCSHCGKNFFDPQSKELAFQPYEPLDIFGHMHLSLHTAISRCAWVPIILAIFTKIEFHFIWVLLLGFVAIFFLSLGFRLLNRKNFEKKRLKAWEESDRRLRKQTYAVLLANHGYPVPPNYLPSGFKRDPQAAIYQRIKTGPFQSSTIK